MSTSELDFASNHEASYSASDPKSGLRLQRDMTRVAATAGSRAELLAGLLDVASRQSTPLAAFFLERGADGKLGDPQFLGGLFSIAVAGADGGGRPNAVPQRDPADDTAVRVAGSVPAEAASSFEVPATLDRLARQVASAARNACRAGEMEIRRHALPPLIALAAPVPRRGQEPHACGAVFRPADSPAQLALLWQLLIAHIVLWEALQASAENARAAANTSPANDISADRRDALPSSTSCQPEPSPSGRAANGSLASDQATLSSDEPAARDSDATIDLMERALAAATTRQAGQALCEALREHLGCERVLIGLRASPVAGCRLAAISQVARFDRRGESIRRMEAAMNEALLRGGSAVWPPRVDDDRHALLAHKALAESEHVAAILSVPLQAGNSPAVGVVTLTFSAATATSSASGPPVGDTANSVPQSKAEPQLSAAAGLLAVAGPSLAIVLDTVRQREGGRLARSWRQLQNALAGWRSAAFAGVALVCSGALSWPLPYRVACECRVEPAVRRFVVAPHDGVLERVFAKPGEIVEEGQLLARLEDRALRLERPALEAELHQAAKKRDVALAKNDSSARQIAELEIRQFASKLRLLDDRAEHLELPSPVKGVVASGDLERAEGATLEEGQSLFEIVLLDRMIVEIAVPDGEIAHIRAGQTVDVRLDAYPGRAWSASLERVQPRAEIRDEQNVFIAEIELDNTDERLRPGMKGRAKVATDRRPLGWILFHKPWEYVVKRLAW